MDYRELETLGLAEKEAKVYLASLELGKNSAQNIAKRAGVNRATTYVVIENLMKKGLLSSITEGKKQYFMAESPEKLNLLFREQEQEIGRRKEYLKNLMPELRSMEVSEKDRPVVRYFEGKEGLVAMTEEFYITSHNDIARMIYPLDLIKEIFSEEDRFNFTERRIKQKVKTDVLYTCKEGSRKSTADGTRQKIDENKYPLTGEIAIYDDKIRISSLKGRLMGMIIEDKEIANTLKSLFELAKKGANK